MAAEPVIKILVKSEGSQGFGPAPGGGAPSSGPSGPSRPNRGGGSGGGGGGGSPPGGDDDDILGGDPAKQQYSKEASTIASLIRNRISRTLATIVGGRFGTGQMADYIGQTDIFQKILGGITSTASAVSGAFGGASTKARVKRVGGEVAEILKSRSRPAKKKDDPGDPHDIVSPAMPGVRDMNITANIVNLKGSTAGGGGGKAADFLNMASGDSPVMPALRGSGSAAAGAESAAAGSSSSAASTIGSMANTAAIIALPIAVAEIGNQVSGKITEGITSGIKSATSIGAQLINANTEDLNKSFVSLGKGASELVSKIPLVGNSLAMMPKILFQVMEAATILKDAFLARAQELARFSPDITVAQTNRDVQGLFRQMDEAERLGPKLGKLIDLQTEMDEATHELNMIFKEFLIEVAVPLTKFLTNQIQTMSMVLNGIKSSVEAVSAMAVYSDPKAMMVKAIVDALRQYFSSSKDPKDVHESAAKLWDNLFSQMGNNPFPNQPMLKPSGAPAIAFDPMTGRMP